MFKPMKIWNATLASLGVIKQHNPAIPILQDNLFDRDIAATEAAAYRRRFGGYRIETNTKSLR